MARMAQPPQREDSVDVVAAMASLLLAFCKHSFLITSESLEILVRGLAPRLLEAAKVGRSVELLHQWGRLVEDNQPELLEQASREPPGFDRIGRVPFSRKRGAGGVAALSAGSRFLSRKMATTADANALPATLQWYRDGANWIVGLSTGAIAASIAYYAVRPARPPRARGPAAGDGRVRAFGPVRDPLLHLGHCLRQPARVRRAVAA